MNKHTNQSTAFANSKQEVGIMKQGKNMMVKLLFGALVISSFAACNQIPEPVVLDFDDTVITSDGSSLKIPGVVPDGEVAELQPSDIVAQKWVFPQKFPKACNTSANIVKNPKFMLGVVGSSNMPPATIANWQQANGTPQSSGWVMGHGNPGYVQMWGYGNGGEAVKQTSVPFMANSSYDVYFSAQQFSTANPTQLHARFMASLGSVANPWTYGAAIDVPIMGPVINSPTTAWAMYGPYNLTTGSTAPDTITLASSNLSPLPVANPSSFSWGQYDNVCILPKPPTEKADISIKKDLKGPAIAGQPNTYILNVNNAGPGAGGSPVTVTDVLPAGVTYNPTISFPAGWSCNTSSLPTITCTIPSMPVGNAQIYIPVTFNPGQVGLVRNCASVSAPNDTTPDNNEACIKNEVMPPQQTENDASITKTLLGEQVLIAGGTAAYQLQSQNLGGPISSGPVTVTDAVSSNLQVVLPVTAGPNWDCTLSTITQVNCTYIGAFAIPTGFSSNIVFKVLVSKKALSGVWNCATVNVPNAINLSNDYSCVKHPVKNAILADNLSDALLDLQAQLETTPDGLTEEQALARVTTQLAETVKGITLSNTDIAIGPVAGSLNQFNVSNKVPGGPIIVMNVNCTYANQYTTYAGLHCVFASPL
jgi:uncharacterized repeat protein (TIGR01451 family)